MSSIFETLANASAGYLHSQSLDAERAEAIRAAILKQWKERDEPKAKHLSETTGIGKYTMVFEYKPQLQRDEFEQLIPEEFKNVPSDKGSVFVWWGAHDPSKYEIHLNFETPRNIRINELKEAQKKEEKEEQKLEDLGQRVCGVDTSITYVRCPKGYHFIDDEGHIARNKKRERGDDDKSEAEKDAENVQAILDDYAKDEAAVAEGVAAKRVRVENLKTVGGRLVMDEALAGIAHFGYRRIEDKEELALAWERTLLNDITGEAPDTFASAIQRAEAADAAEATAEA